MRNNSTSMQSVSRQSGTALNSGRARDRSRSRDYDEGSESEAEDAQKTEATLDGPSQLLVKIDAARALEKRRKCTAFIRNLAYRVTEEELRTTFGLFGTIRRVDYPQDEETGQFKGYAFVEYTEERPAKDAIAALDGLEMWGVPIMVIAPSDKTKEEEIKPKKAVPEPPNGKWLFGTAPFKCDLKTDDTAEKFVSRGRVVKVANVPDNFTEEETKQIFDAFGEIMAVNLIPHRREAFIHFYNAEHAKQSVKTMDGFKIGSCKLGVSIDEMNEKASSTLIVLKDLIPAEEVDDNLKDEIFVECQKYGKVQEIRVHIVPNTKEVRVFVIYRLPEEANRALRVLHARSFARKKIQCEYYDLFAYKRHQYNN